MRNDMRIIFVGRVVLIRLLHYVVRMTAIWETGTIPRFDINDRLRKARENTRMTAGQFADHIGVSRNTVSNYEDSGYAKTRKDSTIRLWAIASGIPYTWIRTGHEPSPTGGNVDVTCK